MLFWVGFVCLLWLLAGIWASRFDLPTWPGPVDEYLCTVAALLAVVAVWMMTTTEPQPVPTGGTGVLRAVVRVLLCLVTASALVFLLKAHDIVDVKWRHWSYAHNGALVVEAFFVCLYLRELARRFEATKLARSLGRLACGLVGLALARYLVFDVYYDVLPNPVLWHWELMLLVYVLPLAIAWAWILLVLWRFGRRFPRATADRCACCGYPSKYLPEPRCPECGFRMG